MIEKIIEYYNSSKYDFRSFAFENDPLKGYFDQWVSYYRMKWAIAKAVDANSIFEIGVRYGYSAHAFLSALPTASYLGVDFDEASFGGDIGAVDWAFNNLKDQGFDVSVIKENTQHWSRLPNHIFDLVHIDGQQDGNGTYHDLDMAVLQAKYVLVDGYYWTRQNFLAINEWLWLNRAAIDFSIIIPGYAGDLLIRTKLDAASISVDNKKNSESLVKAYTSDYYLRDCGGYQLWHGSRGALLDARLQAVADVGMATGRFSKVLDLGAGRGELSAFFARNGAEVTAIDYSPCAEELILKTLSANENVKKRVTVVVDSVTNHKVYTGEYDLVVAADIVEHLKPEELDIMYNMVSEKLKTSLGSFVIHTAPNQWNYLYQHPKEQKAAIASGFWLPRIRRTWYERLMHINEQSPRAVKKQLSKFFPYVYVWLSDDKNMGGSLIRPYTVRDCREAQGIFAIASHRSINVNMIASVFSLKPFKEQEYRAIDFFVVHAPEEASTNSCFDVMVKVKNRSDRRIASLAPYPYHLSYHWISKSEDVVVWDGQRTPFVPALLPGAEDVYNIRVQSPAKMGRYYLEVAAVQEAVRWHEPIKKLEIFVKDC